VLQDKFDLQINFDLMINFGFFDLVTYRTRVWYEREI